MSVLLLLGNKLWGLNILMSRDLITTYNNIELWWYGEYGKGIFNVKYIQGHILIAQKSLGCPCQFV